MSTRGIAILGTGFLTVAMFASAGSRNNTMRITVLDSETRSLGSDNNGVPSNCDQATFDAYCRSSGTPQMTSTLLVQEGNQAPFRVRCKIESRNSRCEPLPKGESFDAKRDKRGLTIYYVDDNGKERKQFYTLVDAGGRITPPPTAPALAVQPATAAAPPPQSSPKSSPTPAPVPQTAAPVQNSPAPTAAPPPVRAQSGLAQNTLEKVRCNFTSTPPGADITIDGSYVGNTPSEISLTTGRHVVQIALVGFGEWKRELTVTSDSAVNVAANLQKTQP